jgi:hypothetical protein
LKTVLRALSFQRRVISRYALSFRKVESGLHLDNSSVKGIPFFVSANNIVFCRPNAIIVATKQDYRKKVRMQSVQQ